MKNNKLSIFNLNLENFNNCSYAFLSSLESSMSIVLTFLPGSLNEIN